MRIILTHPGAEMYGSDRMVLETAKAFIGAGHRVVLVTPHRGLLTESADKTGIDVRVVDMPVLRKRVLTPRGLVEYCTGSLLAILRARRVVRAMGADAIVVNTIIQPQWMIIARLLGLRLIVHVRESEDSSPLLVRFFLLAPLMLANLIIANSESTATFVQTTLRWAAPRTCVVYNGKDWSGYLSGRVDYSEGPWNLTLVGRLSPRKGQDIAITAVNALRRTGLDVRLTIVGEVFQGYEWYREELKQLIKELRLEEVCSLVGFSSDIVPYLSSAHFLVVPSRVEPFGTVAVEGMAARRCVLVADVGGLPEIIGPSISEPAGVIVSSPADPESWSRSIRELIRDPSRAALMADTAHLRANEMFSARAYAALMVSSLESVFVTTK